MSYLLITLEYHLMCVGLLQQPDWKSHDVILYRLVTIQCVPNFSSYNRLQLNQNPEMDNCKILNGRMEVIYDIIFKIIM